ncbi:MBL fold metallo-hydrolase [Paenibacillus soyae]|uniref:MBL fold metallo-hydrolase n=1 Tax=Paenibacillus soyae TaxID=2969249 RepID=A0A9X2SAD6_9BACL|nr:MBL fold metallo-hydrolase [Paenibacillus soyae]MCR2806121.1 MBL fold metallo-hydrolase [Paenibacillus soyae]
MRIRRFVNQDQVEQHNSLKQFKRWRKERVRKLRQKDYSYIIPSVEPELPFLLENKTLPTITWIGHSTFFMQIGGLNIVTDPVWSGQMAFQKRLSAPGIPIDRMPPVDVVLVSHSHYDHLSISSLRRLTGTRRLLVPAGLSGKLRLKGFSNVTEFNWWESTVIQGVTFTFVPSQHWTRRNPWDTNSSHWGGWVIESAGAAGGRAISVTGDETRDARKETLSASMREAAASADADGRDSRRAGAEGRPLVSAAPTVYFAGDSGYFRGFREIGSRFRIDVALMPIGAYEPEWFMGPQHVTPEEALQAFEDIRAGWFVPMHYGAFKLADDTPREALDRLEAGRMNKGIGEDRVIVLPLGETWRLANSSPIEPT